MENLNYTNEQLLNLFYFHGQCSRIISRTCRMFNDTYPDLPPMTIQKFKRYESNFLRTGSCNISKQSTSFPVTGNEDNEITVLSYFEANPTASISTAEHDLNLAHSSIHRILRKHRMHNYKFTTVNFLQPSDNARRLEFCQMLLDHHQHNISFLRNIIWTDETKFSHEGIFNRHNSHYWAQQNPFVTRERCFQIKFSFNVFALLSDNKVSYCIYDDNLTSNQYLRILQTTVADFLDTLPLNRYNSCWYQLDGAPAHSSTEVRSYLNEVFGERWIGRGGTYVWPPRSPDLTPLDFYLWGKVKSDVYSSPVNTREELENRVRYSLDNLDPSEIQRATNAGVLKRLEKCIGVNGGHFEQYL